MSIKHIPDEALPRAHDLPGDLQRIALGFEGEFPGQGVRITLTLALLFGGQNLYIRKADAFVRKWRDAAIRQRYNQGDITVSELVSMFRLSATSIFNILGKPDDEQQLNLWDGKK